MRGSPPEETMTKSSKDTGVILALMQRFNEQRLPETLALKERVEQGEQLTEYDIAFLEKVFSDAKHVMPLIDKHPELQPIASRAISLYKEITEKALENEKQS
jgi:hypothetical protein